MAIIKLGVPSAGSLSEGSAQASYLASFHHKVDRGPSCMSGPNFNECWRQGLMLGKQGRIDYFAMIHADLTVLENEAGMRWCDILVEELEATGADFISVPMAIKDERGLCSCGIGNPKNRWNPWRRFTKYELARLPMRFTAQEIGYGDKYLLHNHALCMWDMRKPLWYEPDLLGDVNCVFNFQERLQWIGDEIIRYQDSEDWAYSRMLWQIGAKTCITRRIRTLHQGGINWDNHDDSCCSWRHDEATRAQWQNEDPLEQIQPEPLAPSTHAEGAALVG